MKLLWELILKDIRLYAADRRALMISFLVPVGIASFMAMILGGGGSDSQKSIHVPMIVVDQDQSELSKAMVERLRKSENVSLTVATEEEARETVGKGKAAFAAVFPKGFATKAVAAMHGGPQADMPTFTDPSKATEGQVAKGMLAQAVMQEVVHSAFGTGSGDGAGSESAFRLPYSEVAQTTKAVGDDSEKWSGAAHAFSGMAVQGLLFWAIESAMSILRERRQGIWRRLRAAPVRPFTLLLGKAISSSLRAMLILVFVFSVGILLFHFRINGSLLGFGLVAVAASVMTATFGLFVAAMGKTEQQSRGLSILLVLGMMMLGGAWFPSFLMPAWIQKASLIIPVRWAVDGFDDMTWRGLGLASALPAVGMLFGFALLFGFVALKRISWEIEA